MKVALVGAAGGIGQPLALLLKQSLPSGSTLSLYDVVNIVGVGCDLSHVNTNVKLSGMWLSKEFNLGNLRTWKIPE